MVNGADPACAGNGPPLGVRNRDHRDRGKGSEDHLVLRQVKSPVERSDEWCGLARKQGKWIVIEVKVQQIEIVNPLANLLEHGHVQRIRIADRAIQTQGLRPTCLEVRRSLRIAAREQYDLMSERDQFVGQPRNNTLGASIQPGRNGLGQRGYLCDLHPVILSGSPTVLCRLPLQRLAFRAGTEPDGTRAAIARTYQLGSARLTVAGRRSVSCRPFLDHQVSRLKQELEMDDGFHRTPLVRGRLKALQYVFPLAVGAAQYQLSNELNSIGCAAQYDRWARADTQLWIDWKVRHGQLTPGLRSRFHTSWQ